jgi:acyl-[acyl-carrier-protein]-phospholipid O-acyltransferase / long-chain-fatty-acid--[acyl-carrier-protein] ligase
MPLLTTRRFLPLLLTQFLGALNDNFFKTAVVMLVTYRFSSEFSIKPHTLVIAAGALYMLPYILFCAIGGRLADKFDKAKIARIIKLFEVGFMLLAVLGFYLHLPALLFFVLFCMGMHSALFSPPKYALMPEHLRPEELIEGNAFMEGGTFIATLLGTIAGGPLVLRPNGEFLVSCLLLLIAFSGVIASRYIPSSAIRGRSVRLSLNPITETRKVLAYVTGRRALFKTSLINSWFYFVAITFALLLAPYAESIGANEEVGTLLLTSFTVGIGVGTVTCGALMKGQVSTRAVPWCALGMSLFIFDFTFFSPPALPHPPGSLLTLPAFLAATPGWPRMVFDLFMVAFCGGMFIVPLYAALQWQSPPDARAQVMACNNVINAFFMVGAAVMALSLFALGSGIMPVFLTAGALNAGVVVFLLMPSGRIAEGNA